MPRYYDTESLAGSTTSKVIKVILWLSFLLSFVAAIDLTVTCTMALKGADRQTAPGTIPAYQVLVADIVISILGCLVMFTLAICASCGTILDSRGMAFANFLFGSGYFITGVLSFVCFAQNGVNGIVGLTSAAAEAAKSHHKRAVIIISSGNSKPVHYNSESERLGLVGAWLGGNALMTICGIICLAAAAGMISTRFRQPRH